MHLQPEALQQDVEARAVFGNYLFFFPHVYFCRCELVGQLGGVLRGRGVSLQWLRLPVEEEEATDAVEELQETSCGEVRDGFPQQLLPPKFSVRK